VCSSTGSARDIHPERALRHPVWWVALALLIVNDHLLKGWGPGWLTGKLSDLAGLVVAPALIATLVRVHSRSGLVGAHVGAGVALAAINLSEPAARAVEVVMGSIGLPWRIWVDPTDLVALLALPLAWRWLVPGMRQPKPGHPRAVWALERVGLVAGAVGSMATSMAPPPTVVVAPGRVIAQGWTSDPVYVVDTASGDRLQELSAPEVSASGARIVVNGVLYSVRGTSVFGHRLSDGAEVLDYAADEAYFHSLAATDGHRLILVSSPSGGHSMERVIAVGFDGKAQWSAALPSDQNWRDPSAKPIVTGGLVVVTAGDEVVALDPTGGERRWTYKAGVPLQWVVGAGRFVTAVDEAGVLHTIDAVSGRRAWLGQETNMAEVRWANEKPIGTTDDGALVLFRGDRLVAIDASSQAIRWQGPKGIERVTFGRRYAIASLGEGDAHSRYGLVDLRNGKLVWVRELDVSPDMAPVIAEQEGLVLFQPSFEELVAFEVGSGERRWTFDFDDGAPVIVGQIGGQLLVARRSVY